MASNTAQQDVHAHPRIVGAILEQSSWIDDDMVQEMWAGLLSTSCTEDGDDVRHLIFTNLLGSLTKLQEKVLKYCCEAADKGVTLSGLLFANRLQVSRDQLNAITGEKDLHRLDRELDHMRSMELIQGGFHPHGPEI